MEKRDTKWDPVCWGNWKKECFQKLAAASFEIAGSVDLLVELIQQK